MTDEELFAALDDALAAFGATDPATADEPVPACPGWTVADLVAHVAQVYGWAAALLRAAPDEKVRYADHRPPDGADPFATWAAAASEVRSALATTDLAVPVRTWAGTNPARWWLRRLVHETTMHTWDAQAARGAPAEIREPVAADGIDELFDVFFPARFDAAAFAGHGETLHLHATDGEGEWLVRFDPEGPVVTREHAKGDVAARGRTSDLLCFLWSRLGPEPLEVFGDASILEHYRSAVSF